MVSQEDLLAIEEKLWTGGADEYLDALDEECLVAFTHMSGVANREEIARTLTEAERWRDLEIDVEGLVQPSDDVAIMTYRASAVRGEKDRYAALVSSGYVNRGGSWKMIFHQQTPLVS